MRRILPCLAAALLIGAAPAPRSARKAAPAVWVPFEAAAANAVQQAFAAQGLVPPSIDETRHGIAVCLVREDQLAVLSAVMHERYRLCPGFVSHASRTEALRGIELDAAPPVEEDLTDFYVINTYVGVPWIETNCGYGCSDHQSWTVAGYRASFPFESQFGFHNPTIHSANDTLANSGGNADHSLKFAKLAAAYLAEMAKGALGSPPVLPDAGVPAITGATAR